MMPVLDYISAPELRDIEEWGKLTMNYFDS